MIGSGIGDRWIGVRTYFFDLQYVYSMRCALMKFLRYIRVQNTILYSVGVHDELVGSR